MRLNLYFLLFSLFTAGHCLAQTSLATIESEMVLVEGGSMDIQGRLVTLPSFYCSKFEVTQRLFEEVMGYNMVTKPSVSINPLKPVEYHDTDEFFYLDYMVFCNELNKVKGLPIRYYKDPELKIPVDKADLNKRFNSYEDYGSNGYRLPIAVEWEYAARGGTKSLGYTYSGSNNLYEVAWVHTNGLGVIQFVGLLKPNELGIYDMAGNVAELIFDTKKREYFECDQIWDGGGEANYYGGCSVRFEASLDCMITPDGIFGLRLFKDIN